MGGRWFRGPPVYWHPARQQYPATHPPTTPPLPQFHPDFLPIFKAYDHPVRRADALRPFVLQTFGGMYLDLDVECFAPMDAMLAGADLVLQVGCCGTGDAIGMNANCLYAR